MSEHDQHDHGHDHDHPGGIVGALRSIFAPHSHDHSDSIDDALTASNEGIRALKISLVRDPNNLLLELMEAE